MRAELGLVEFIRAFYRWGDGMGVRRGIAAAGLLLSACVLGAVDDKLVKTSFEQIFSVPSVCLLRKLQKALGERDQHEQKTAKTDLPGQQNSTGAAGEA